jgi:hypothetical protein
MYLFIAFIGAPLLFRAPYPRKTEPAKTTVVKY